MKKLTTVAAAFAAIIAFGPSLAIASDNYCTSAPRSEWRSVDDIKTAAEALDYQVNRVKSEDSCYEIYALDKNGKRVEVYFDPVSLNVVRVKDKS